MPDAKSAEYENLRILVIRENWLGNTGLSVFDALLRAGTWATAICEREYIPIEWKSWSFRLLGRLIRKPAIAEFNRALLRAVEEVNPNALLAVKGTFVKARTLRRLRELGVACYCFYPDVALTGHGRDLPEAIREYDWVFTSKSFGVNDLAAFGQENSSVLPHAYDPVVHRPRKPTPELMKEFGCDLSFIGIWSARKQSMLEQFVSLRPTVRLKIWGNYWERLPRSSILHPMTMFKPITGIGYASAISCSRISLGLLSAGDLITTRTFEIPACGGLLLHERTPDLLEIFEEGISCMCFEGADELATKVDQLLADEGLRARIARRGQEVVMASHSWDHRIRTILDHHLAKTRLPIRRSEAG